MQNKYKLPDYARSQVLGVVRGYTEYKAWLEKEKAKISLLGSSLSAQPRGKGGTSAPTEIQALRLAKLNDTYKARCVRAVDEAFDELPLKDYNSLLATQIKRAIYNSCVRGRKFNFYRSGIVGIEKSYFYKLRQIFIYRIAVKMEIY